MSADNPRREESRFIRRSMPITRDFGMHRNWWVRDPKLAGNPISIYLYLLSHDEEFRVSPQKVMRDLQLGRTAFTTARRVLEEMGFLHTEIIRQPAGATDGYGRSIAGQVIRTDFILDDPTPPLVDDSESPKSQHADFVHQPDPDELAVDNFTDDVESEAYGSNTRDLTPGFPTAGNLTSGFTRLKEDQVQEDQVQEDQSSSSSAPTPGHADDEPDQVDGLRDIHPKLNRQTLVAFLAAHAPQVDATALDLQRAALEILHRAANAVGDPVAYVGRSVIREPGRWVRRELLWPEPMQAPPRGSRPLSAAECGARGHRYVGDWHEACATCGTERPDWRNDRDAAKAERPITAELEETRR